MSTGSRRAPARARQATDRQRESEATARDSEATRALESASCECILALSFTPNPPNRPPPTRILLTGRPPPESTGPASLPGTVRQERPVPLSEKGKQNHLQRGDNKKINLAKDTQTKQEQMKPRAA